jgi:hypothetical protein
MGAKQMKAFVNAELEANRNDEMPVLVDEVFH